MTATDGLTARLYTDNTCDTQSGTDEATVSSGTADVETPTLNTGTNTFYGGVVDTAGNVSCFTTAVSYTKSPPVVSATIAAVTPSSVGEGDLNGAIVELTLSNATFNATTHTRQLHHLNDRTHRLRSTAIYRQSDDARCTVRLTLAYTGADFDSDTNITVTIAASEHSGSAAITSDRLSVTAVNDPPKATPDSTAA